LRRKVWQFADFEKIKNIIKDNKEIGIEFVSCSSFSDCSRIHRILAGKQFRSFVLAQELLNLHESQMIIFDVFVHFGTLIAWCLFFGKIFLKYYGRSLKHLRH